MTRWSLFLQTLSLLHHFLGLYWGYALVAKYCSRSATSLLIISCPNPAAARTIWTTSSCFVGPAPLLQGRGLEAAPPTQPPPSPIESQAEGTPSAPRVAGAEAFPPAGPFAEPPVRGAFEAELAAAPPVSGPETTPPSRQISGAETVSSPGTYAEPTAGSAFEAGPTAAPPVSEPETAPSPPQIPGAETVSSPEPYAEPTAGSAFEAGPTTAPPVSEPETAPSPPQIPGAEIASSSGPVGEPPTEGTFGPAAFPTPPAFKAEVVAREGTAETPGSAAPTEGLLSSLSQGFDPAAFVPQQAHLPQEDSQEPAPEPPKRRTPRGSPLRDMVAVLQRQVDSQREELESRRREIQELHVLLQQLQTRALPPPPETKPSFWQSLWRRR